MTDTVRQQRERAHASIEEVLDELRSRGFSTASAKSFGRWERRTLAGGGKTWSTTGVRPEHVAAAVETVRARHAVEGRIDPPTPDPNAPHRLRADDSALVPLRLHGVTEYEFKQIWADTSYDLPDVCTLTGMTEAQALAAARALGLVVPKPFHAVEVVDDGLTTAQRANKSYRTAGETHRISVTQQLEEAGIGRDKLMRLYDTWETKPLAAALGFSNQSALYIALGAHNIPLRGGTRVPHGTQQEPLPEGLSAPRVTAVAAAQASSQVVVNTGTSVTVSSLRRQRSDTERQLAAISAEIAMLEAKRDLLSGQRAELTPRMERLDAAITALETLEQ